MSAKPEAFDESTLTEIMIQPDGRIYLFGASRDVLEILESLAPTDTALRRILDHLRRTDAPSATYPKEECP